MKFSCFKIILATLVLIQSSQVFCQIERLVADEKLHGASISASLIDAITGEVLEAHDEEVLLCPASVLKLATTAAAIDVLGKDFRFSTTLAYSGEIQDGILSGDLLIIGSGDPSFCSNHFGNDLPFVMEQFVDMVKAAGIDSISGGVIGNGAHLQGQPYPGTRVWEDIGNYYGTGIHGLNANDNTYFVSYATPEEPDLPAKLLSIYPEVPDLVLESEVLSSTIQSDQAYIYGSPLESKRIVRGTLPLGRDRFTIKGSIPDPARFVAFHLRNELREAGINSLYFKSELKTFREPVTYTKIGTTESVPLSEMVKHVNLKSDNLMAEGLLLQLGAKEGNPSLEGGVDALENYLKQIWGKDSSFYLYDGSGLSRFTAISAHQMTKLLLEMRSTPELKRFVLDQLPRAGREGTVKWFGQRTNLTDNVQLKSGSMKNVKAYAGIMTTYSGRELAFAILINNYDISGVELRKKIEDWLLRAYGRY
jgi:D-alanyl-D-alanine carboxypeptidase/D-alanyl-D-alanine-endopeptidase (penicillin-binding protein 4)